MKVTQEGWDKYATIKVTGIDYCQSCGKKYEELELVYFAPLDNNIVCKECSKAHNTIEPRLFVKDLY